MRHHSFAKPMTFEEERIAWEEHQEFERRRIEKLEALDHEPTIEDMVRVMNEVTEEMHPESGDLKYEIDEEFSESDLA